MIVTDEFKTPWVTFTTDPAHSIINTLRKYGFEYIVLPRATFTSGLLPSLGSYPSCSEASLKDPTDPFYLTSVRLRYCLDVLNK